MHGGGPLDADKRPPKLRNGLSFERRRTDLAERRMTASLVVERVRGRAARKVIHSLLGK